MECNQSLVAALEIPYLVPFLLAEKNETLILLTWINSTLWGINWFARVSAINRPFFSSFRWKFLSNNFIGRNDDETKMIRIAVDDAIDDIIESGINERETDIEAIKEKIFLEVASRLEEAKLSSQVRLNDSTEQK